LLTAARFNWISLVYTFNWLGVRRFEARIPAGPNEFCVTPALETAENPGGVFPKVNCLTLVVDWSRFSSKFMWWTGTAITLPLLGKPTDVYN
jgi:hypothetical protein